MRNRRHYLRAFTRPMALMLLLLVAPLMTISAQSTRAQRSGTQPPEIVPLLFVAERDGAVFYLYGSIHAAPPEALPPPIEVREAFERSSLLVTEVPLSDDLLESMSIDVAEMMFYPEGESLDELFTANEWQTVVEWARGASIPIEVIRQMRPWAASVMVAESAPTPPGFSFENGLDLYFGNKGAARGVPNIGLETVDEQLRLLAAGTPSEQAALFLESIVNIEDSMEVIDLYEAWRAGDVDALEQIVLDGVGPAESDAFVALLVARNENWADRIANDPALSLTGPSFVVVGAAHLVGPGNLLELLEADGFSVRRVSSSEDL